MKFPSYLLLIFLLPIFQITSAYGEGSDSSGTLIALDRLEKALRQDKGLANKTKDALQDLVTALKEERVVQGKETKITEGKTSQVNKGIIASVVDEYLKVRPPLREEREWEKRLERLKFYGDFRARHESNFKLDNRRDQHRERLRVRLGTNYQLSDEVLLGIRIVTGDADDPNSPHVTLGDMFDSFDISLDRAFLTYQPEWLDGFLLTAGKFDHAFYENPVYSELVWDADVQPEGGIIGYTWSNWGPLEKLSFVVGEYTILEQSQAEDTFAMVLQLSGHLRLTDTVKLNLATGYYYYSDTNPEGSLSILEDNSGNAVVDVNGDMEADKFVSDFGILNPIIAFTYEGWKSPLTLSAEYILNTRAHGGDDQGWAVGASLGKAQKKKDLRFYYQWQWVEQEAIFSPFAQDDFLFSTNHQSHLLGVNYQLTDNIGGHLWALVSRRDKAVSGPGTDSDEDQWRLRFDLNVKF